MWRYQHLYELMCADKRFDAHIVLSPSIDYTHEQQERDVNAMRTFFDERDIKYVDYSFERPCDVKSELNPDILFYPQPYENLL